MERLEKAYRDNKDLFETLNWVGVNKVVYLVNYENGKEITVKELKELLSEDADWDLSVEDNVVYINIMGGK